MRKFFENDGIVFYLVALVAIIAGFAIKNYFNEKERLIECLKNEKCLEYVKKYDKAPSIELQDYITKD